MVFWYILLGIAVICCGELLWDAHREAKKDREFDEWLTAESGQRRKMHEDND